MREVVSDRELYSGGADASAVVACYVEMEWPLVLLAVLLVTALSGLSEAEAKSKPGRGRGSMWW